MKKANILLDDQSTGLTIIEKLSFERVDGVFDTLHWAFHPEGFDAPDHNLDHRCIALWHLFLASVGWTEDEFWEEWDNRPRSCSKCDEEKNKNGDENKSEEDQTPPEFKSN